MGKKRDHLKPKNHYNKITKDKFSLDSVIGEIKVKGLKFSTSICTKTVYNMIDRGDFYNLTNNNLVVKRNKPKREYKKTSKIAKNNITGLSIEKKLKESMYRREKGIERWIVSLVKD